MKATSKQTLAVGIGAIFGILALAVVAIIWGAFWGGLTASVLWGWFVVPLFGLPAIGLWQAYGLSLVLSALRGLLREPSKDGGAQAFARLLIQPPLFAGLMLGAGWFVRAWA